MIVFITCNTCVWYATRVGCLANMEIIDVSNACRGHNTTNTPIHMKSDPTPNTPSGELWTVKATSTQTQKTYRNQLCMTLGSSVVIAMAGSAWPLYLAYIHSRRFRLTMCDSRGAIRIAIALSVILITYSSHSEVVATKTKVVVTKGCNRRPPNGTDCSTVDAGVCHITLEDGAVIDIEDRGLAPK